MHATSTFIVGALAMALVACATPTDSPEPTLTPTPAASPAETPAEEATPERTPETTPSPEPTSAFEDPSSCTNDELGFTVEYPGDWWANDEVTAEDPVADIAACTYFAPEPVELTPGTDDLSGVAIRFDLEPSDIDRPGEILHEQEVTVDGRDALALEREPEPQAGFIDEGERIYQVIIELDGDEDLVVTTDTINQDESRYDDARDVLDAMVETLEIDA